MRVWFKRMEAALALFSARNSRAFNLSHFLDLNATHLSYPNTEFYLSKSHNPRLQIALFTYQNIYTTKRVFPRRVFMWKQITG